MKKTSTPPSRPPRDAEWLLRRLFADSGDYSHLGDFEEIHTAKIAELGKRRADRWYWGHVFKSLPAFLANKIYWSMSMLRNYAVMTCRTIVKNAGYSLISLLGLAVGLASFLLILAYVRFETSFDRFHDKGDDIYRLISAEVKPGETPGEFEANSPDPAASTLKNEFPEVRHAARVMKQFNDPAILSFEGRAFAQSGLIADQDFLEIFSFPWIAGDKSRALTAPGTIILTESTARKLYGDADPVGKTVSYAIRRGKADLMVSGVVRDVPARSHLQFDYLLSLATLEADRNNAYMFKTWDVANFTIYVETAAARDLENKFGAWLAKAQPDVAAGGLRFFLQPLKDIHLHSNISGQLATNNEIRTVSLFLAIAVLILLIASVNYTNLVTARASTRAREIGVRKVAGADRRQLVRQFLGESILFAFLALGAGLALARLVLARFNDMAGIRLGFGDLIDPSFFPFVAATTLVVGLLAGAYPALMLSSFQASKVLKEHAASGRKGSRLRHILVVGQFAASVALLICALVVTGQLRFIQNRNLGYDREHVVLIPLREPGTAAQASALKARLLQQPEVESVSRTSGLPTAIRSRMIDQQLVSDSGETIKTEYHFDYIDEDFLDVFKIELAAGRNLAPAEQNAVLLNETFIKMAGWKEPLGKEVDFRGKSVVVGIVKDFNFGTLHSPLAPMALFPNEGNILAVRLRPGNLQAAVDSLRRSFETVTRSQPWEYAFFDEEFDALYKKERRAGQLFRTFAGLSVFIACLGLLGLASFAVERRTKEIGIRRILGASSSGLALKLSREFLGLVLIANVIAWPAAYFAMSRWLQSFAYRINLGWGTFLLAGFGALVLALITVGTQTIRASSSNPVDSLRYE